MKRDKYRREAKKAREERNCRNKKAYKTEAHAMKAANGFSMFRLKPYKCAVCNQIHLTKGKYKWKKK